MFNRPKVLSPTGNASKRPPFTDLQNVKKGDDVTEAKGLNGFDWNRKLDLKKPSNSRPKKKFILKVAEEKGNDENYSPNTKTAMKAFGVKKTPVVGYDRAESKTYEDNEGFTASLDEDSPRLQEKDFQHEHLLDIAQQMSSPPMRTPPEVKGPPSDMVSPPSRYRRHSSMGLVGSPLLNVTMREEEMSPNTPDLSVSPSQQKTPPLQLSDDFSQGKSTTSEEKSSSDEKKNHSDYQYEQYDENYNYDHEYGYDHEAYTEYYKRNEEYPPHVEETVENTTEEDRTAQGRKHDEVFANNTSLQALTPVKLKYSMTVLTEVSDSVSEVSDLRSLTDSPDSTSSRLTSMSHEMEMEQLFSKVRHNRVDEVTSILSSSVAKKSKDSNGNTLLHICAQNNLRKMASIILDHGVNINAENKKGYTALDYCDNYNFQKLGDWFVKHGGDNSHKQLGL